MIGILTLAVFVTLNTAIGLRLVWNAAHGGGGPVWACGLGFTFIGLLGYPLTMIAGVGSQPVGELHHALAAAGIAFTGAGLASFYFFTLFAFRQSQLWAWMLACGATLALGVVVFGEIGALAAADPGMHSAEAADVWMRMTGLLSTLCYAWGGFEGMTEWGRARRRAALGLTDPLVANRILLWGIHGIAVTCLNLLLMTLNYQGVNTAESTAAQVAMAALALVSSTVITLAFFPSKTWARWVRGQAGPPHAQAAEA